MDQQVRIKAGFIIATLGNDLLDHKPSFTTSVEWADYVIKTLADNNLTLVSTDTFSEQYLDDNDEN